MQTLSAEKKSRQGLSIDPELLASAKKKAGANLSAYIRELIERDLSETAPLTADTKSASILLDLTRRLLGELKERRLKSLLPPTTDQAELLGKLLERFIEEKAQEHKAAQALAMGISTENLSALAKKTPVTSLAGGAA